MQVSFILFFMYKGP